MTNKKPSVTKQSELLLSLLPVRQLRCRLPWSALTKDPQKIFKLYIQLTPVRKEGMSVMQ
ncbi:hypothetical protein ACLK1T_17690 [Escherichia coli]